MCVHVYVCLSFCFNRRQKNNKKIFTRNSYENEIERNEINDENMEVNIKWIKLKIIFKVTF